MLNTPIQSRKLGLAVCKSLGIDPSKVCGVDFKTDIDKVATVEVGFIITKKLWESILNNLGENHVKAESESNV